MPQNGRGTRRYSCCYICVGFSHYQSTLGGSCVADSSRRQVYLLCQPSASPLESVSGLMSGMFSLHSCIQRHLVERRQPGTYLRSESWSRSAKLSHTWNRNLVQAGKPSPAQDRGKHQGAKCERSSISKLRLLRAVLGWGAAWAGGCRAICGYLHHRQPFFSLRGHALDFCTDDLAA